jgi:hypothetical protein
MALRPLQCQPPIIPAKPLAAAVVLTWTFHNLFRWRFSGLLAIDYVSPAVSFWGFYYSRNGFPSIEAPASRVYVYHLGLREGVFMRTRFCRVCGQPFQPVRFDALTCSTTCRIRKSRGAD